MNYTINLKHLLNDGKQEDLVLANIFLLERLKEIRIKFIFKEVSFIYLVFLHKKYKKYLPRSIIKIIRNFILEIN